MTMPTDPVSQAKHDAGGIWLGKNVLIGLFLSFLIIIGAIAYTVTVINARASDNQNETSRVAKCSFQFSAYRAQYAGATNTAIKPIKGLDPYAGLTLPQAQAIAKHLSDNCQRYLQPFIK